MSVCGVQGCILDCSQNPDSLGCVGVTSSSGSGTGGRDVGSSSSSSSGVGGMSGTSTSSSGMGGTGGAALCVPCADYFGALMNGQTPGEICPDSQPGMGSASTLKALIQCICDTNQGCGADCNDSTYCFMGANAPTTQCNTCLKDKKCSTPFAVCAGDL